MLFLVRMRYCETADTASRLGMETWYSSISRSDRMMMLAPSLYARSTSRKTRSMAFSRLVFL